MVGGETHAGRFQADIVVENGTGRGAGQIGAASDAKFSRMGFTLLATSNDVMIVTPTYPNGTYHPVVRGRPVENRWAGQRIHPPAPDLGMLARAQGVTGIAAVHERQCIASTLAEGERTGEERGVVVDVHVAPAATPRWRRGLRAPTVRGPSL